MVVYNAKKNFAYNKSKSILYALYLLINQSSQNLNIVFHGLKYFKKIGPDQVEIYFQKLFYGIKIVVSSIASQATMRKGSLIEFFFIHVPSLYLCSYKDFFTLPTPDRKKKEKKKFQNFWEILRDEIEVFQAQRLVSAIKHKFFFGFTNEMLLEKKEVNKNFFFNEKLLIFVPLHKNFFGDR